MTTSEEYEQMISGKENLIIYLILCNIVVSCSVDDLLHAAIQEDILKTFPTPRTLVLLTGDGNTNGGRTSFPKVQDLLCYVAVLHEIVVFAEVLIYLLTCMIFCIPNHILFRFNILYCRCI